MMEHGHRFALYSVTGVHIGLWSDMRIAMDVQREYPDSYIEEMVMLSDHDTEITQLRAELEQERELADELAQASKRGLNYLENTENELGILLDGAESIRGALTDHATRRNR